MSIGIEFLSALVKSGSVTDLLELKPKEDLFYKDEVTLFNFIYNFAKKFGALPKDETVEAEIGMSIVEVREEPIKYYWDSLVKRFIFDSMQKEITSTYDKLSEHPDDCKDILDGFLNNLFALKLRKKNNLLYDFRYSGYDVIVSEYDKMLKGDTSRGILFNWKTLDRMMGGAKPGDLISLIARPSKGKTLLLLYVGNSAYTQRKVPLIVSIEMKPDPDIIQRMGAIYTHCNLNYLQRGIMSTPVWEKTKKSLKSLSKKGSLPFWVVDGSNLTLEDIYILCAFLNVDILIVDGAYLTKYHDKSMNRTERVTRIAEDLKLSIAQELNIPVVASWQFNREMEKIKNKKDIGTEYIGMSDAIGQLSTVALGLFEDDTVETDEKREVTIMKGRNGESGRFFVNWNFNIVDFKEWEEKKSIEFIL
jgi:replicative DNA helicase